LIPNPTVSYTSPNATGTLAFTPVANASGTATITVTVNDGQAQNNTFARTFTVSVNAANRLPIISAITNVIISQNTSTPAIPFTIGDVETPAAQLTLSGSSSNPLVVQNSGIVFGGSGANRTVTVTPLPDRGGDTEITVTVSDGEATASTTFLLTVLGPPPPPSSLTIVTNGTGTISGAPTSQNVVEGQIFTLTAVAGEGQVFTGWSGSTNTTSPTLRVRAGSNLVVQANFAPLSLTTAGTGTITPNLKKTRNMVVGRTYSLRATPGLGQMFVGWSGSTNTDSPVLTFVMSTNVNLKANFVPVNLSVAGKGLILPDLRKTANLTRGRAYTLRALPSVGQEFAEWTGSTNSDSPTIRVTLDTNLVLRALFVPSPYIPIAGSYNGLFHEEDEVRRHTSGFFSLSVTPRGTYSGWLQTGVGRHSFSGKLKLDLGATNIINRPLSTPLTLKLKFGSGSTIDQVTGLIEEGYWTATLNGDRTIFNVRTNPAPYAGSYTLVLPGQLGDDSLPEGHGHGTVRVTTAGRATFTGWTGDGARLMQSVALSKNGDWPLHALLPYGTSRGTLMGWMKFANRPNDDLNGALSWIKPANELNKFYPSGFNQELDAVGSVYRMPVGPQTNFVLNLTQANVAFSGGNLEPDFANAIEFGPYSRIINLDTNRLILTFSPALGTFSGTVQDPATLKTLSFKGVVLQKQNAGFGLLTGTNQTSRVEIKAP
ncbi:MAG: hypothetical protein KJ070_23545, partial [Verrucomicrobia bacterium]|nr:hypothetical protein [Verrucomicrobiota bacterium]